MITGSPHILPRFSGANLKLQQKMPKDRKLFAGHFLLGF
jgi:hypothetical protein